VSFDVSPGAYLRFMGRYSEPLAARFADLAGVRGGQRVLDVGCGPGALTAELVRRVGAESVSAVEPSASFAAAVRERLPGVDVRQSAAEQLPFPDGPAAAGESDLPGVREGHLASLFTQAGLGRTQVSTLTVRVRHASFDDWWQPFTLGVGPAGAYVASLPPARQAALRERCRHLLPPGTIEITAAAWAASGHA
jgi:SAM-dependent methyltransferase